MSSSARASQQEIDRLATLLAKDPRSKVFMPLADEYGKAGMWQEAVGVLEDGLRVYPGFMTAMVALGCAYEQVGSRDKAKNILEEAVKASPENLRGHRTLAKMYAADGAIELALRSCQVLLTLNPQDEEAINLKESLDRQFRAAETAAITNQDTASLAKVEAVQTLTKETSPAAPAHESSDPKTPRQDGRSSTVRKLEDWLEHIQKTRQSDSSRRQP